MPDHEDSLGGDTLDGDAKADRAEQSLGDGATMGDTDTANPSSMGDQLTSAGTDEVLGVNLGDDDMQIIDLDDRYAIESVLGKGGMGEVLLATDKRLDRKVAIKRILGKAARSAKAWQRFEKGAKTIAKLNHPNIVQVYEYGRAKDGPFMILECVTGGSLLDRCKQGPIPSEEAVDIASQLCDGIAKAHAEDIIHRDIKPANVLMTEDGIPKLNDFDLAKSETADTGMTQEGAVLGTLDFMPPEQRQNAALVDQRSDLWSMAATVYQMVTGEIPRVIDLDLVPRELRNCLAKALKTKKDDRYQTARDFRDALRGSLTATDQPAVEVVTALGEGECPKCHSRNESSRKFCNGCGASLRVSCVGCEEEIPVWEQFCAECGGNQPDLIAARFEVLIQQRNQAEQLRSEYSYEAALQIAKELAAIEDERILQHKSWAVEFINSLQQENEREQNSARQYFEESKKHSVAFDFSSAIQAILAIPEPLRSDEVVSHLERLESDQQESDGLNRTIKERIKQRDLEGLLGLVDRAVELRGDREVLRNLQGHLRDREAKLTRQCDETYMKAKDLFEKGKAKAALVLIKKVETWRFSASQLLLKDTLEEAVNAETELLAMLTSANADDVIEAEEAIRLLPKAIDCYRLNPSHSKIRCLRDDLMERLSRMPKKPFQFNEGRITNLTVEAAEALSTIEGNLTLDALTTLSIKKAEALARTNDKLSLNGLKGFKSGVADALSEHNGDLSLDGIKKLTDYDAISLSKHRKHHATLSMIGLENLSENATRIIMNHDGLWAPEIKTQLTFTNSVGMTFLLVQGGEFEMGEPGCDRGENQAHQVRITRRFYLGTLQVTQQQYETVMDDNPSLFRRPNLPVEHLTWTQANKFAERLSAREEEKVAGRSYRLPTEAEWEYACRAGTTKNFSIGNAPLQHFANFSADNNNWGEARQTTSVGSFKPNPWGFYDMHGNVWEWCSDWFDAEYYGLSPTDDPCGPSQGSYHVLRGGSASTEDYECSSYFRGEASTDGPRDNTYQGGIMKFEACGDFGIRLVCEMNTNSG
jgi:formylglycine-generating enzyme required for sulfatase activity/serine/threonine protein kinase